MNLLKYYLCALVLFNGGQVMGSFPVEKPWADMEDEVMDFTAPLVFNDSCPPLPIVPPAMKSPNPTSPTNPTRVLEDKPRALKNVASPHMTPFKILTKGPNEKKESQPLNQTLKVPPKTTSSKDRLVLLKPPAAPETSIPPKQVRLEIIPRKIPRVPEHVIHNMGEDLTQKLEELWRPDAVNILLLEVAGPIFTANPLLNNAYAVAQLAIQKVPALAVHFQNPAQQDRFTEWLHQKIATNQFQRFFVSDPLFLKGLDEGLWQKSFEVQLTVDFPLAMSNVILKDLQSHQIKLGVAEFFEADSKEIKDAGFVDGVFLRNGHENPFMPTMGYLLNTLEVSYQAPLNVIHVHTFLNEQDLQILKNLFPGYQSIWYENREDMLLKVFNQEKVLEHILDEFMVPLQEESYFLNFPLPRGHKVKGSVDSD